MDTTTPDKPSRTVRTGPVPLFRRSLIANLICLSQLNDDEFAALVGGSRFTVRNWRLGTKNPKTEDLRRFTAIVSEHIGRRVTLDELATIQD